eukprot:CAMPEP_0181309694 /NCGR_PEP_ID=MMETSP1101-20121128/12155_1 /TAXON_ID=46948 /ORGANISM="Rhodomonas abbreviata, Strain Caron Lab Isolate" /LENGTH=36 /DNA_ID= /DNA_START= /DNA_END= /DNA_ORIENTATION=
MKEDLDSEEDPESEVAVVHEKSELQPTNSLAKEGIR